MRCEIANSLRSLVTFVVTVLLACHMASGQRQYIPIDAANRVHQFKFEASLLSPDGRFYVVAWHDGPLVCETLTGKPITRFTPNPSLFTPPRIALSPDGKLLVASDGQAVARIGGFYWNAGPEVPYSNINFVGGEISDPIAWAMMLPEKQWHQFRYEMTRWTPPDNSNPRNPSEFHIWIGFPFWSAFVVLLIPLLVPLVRRTSGRMMERRHGFTPIFKEQPDETK